MEPNGILVASKNETLASAIHSVLGPGALFAGRGDQGIAAEALPRGTGIEARQLDDPQARMTQQRKPTILRTVLRPSAVPDVGLRAAARQRPSDFGVYGYALVSRRTFGDATLPGIKPVRLAGPVLDKRFRVQGDTAIVEVHDALDLGNALPLAAEFWWAPILGLASRVLQAPMPSRRLLLPHPRPAHAQAYQRMFGCAVEFGARVMEWHFDAAVLGVSCPNTNPITAGLCAQFCARMLMSMPEESDLARRLRTLCLNSRGEYPNADEAAARPGLSVRTLHRRLADQGQHDQPIVDDVCLSLAIEFLENKPLSVEEIAGRVGFSQASSLRKALRKRTGQAPAHYRTSGATADGAA